MIDIEDEVKKLQKHDIVPHSLINFLSERWWRVDKNRIHDAARKAELMFIYNNKELPRESLELIQQYIVYYNWYCEAFGKIPEYGKFIYQCKQALTNHTLNPITNFEKQISDLSNIADLRNKVTNPMTKKQVTTLLLATHQRVGKESPFRQLPQELSEKIVGHLLYPESSTDFDVQMQSWEEVQQTEKENSIVTPIINTEVDDLEAALELYLPTEKAEINTILQQNPPNDQEVVDLFFTQSKNLSMVKYLLQNHPDLLAKKYCPEPRGDEKTILRYSIKYGYLHTVAFLIAELKKQKTDIMAEVTASDEEESALYYVVSDTSNSMFATNKKILALICQELSPGQSLVNTKDKYGQTPLHYAVRVCNIKIIKTLLAGLSPEQKLQVISAKDKYGQTLLHYAVRVGNIERIKTLLAGLSPQVSKVKESM